MNITDILEFKSKLISKRAQEFFWEKVYNPSKQQMVHIIISYLFVIWISMVLFTSSSLLQVWGVESSLHGSDTATDML